MSGLGFCAGGGAGAGGEGEGEGEGLGAMSRTPATAAATTISVAAAAAATRSLLRRAIEERWETTKAEVNELLLSLPAAQFFSGRDGTLLKLRCFIESTPLRQLLPRLLS